MRVLIHLWTVPLVLAGALTWALAFNAPRTPPSVDSMANSFVRVDFSNLPPISQVIARDGTALSYRAYPGQPTQVAMLAVLYRAAQALRLAHQ